MDDIKRRDPLIRGADGVLYRIDATGCVAVGERTFPAVRRDRTLAGYRADADSRAGRFNVVPDDHEAGRFNVVPDDHGTGRFNVVPGDGVSARPRP